MAELRFEWGLDPTVPAWLTWYIPIGVVAAIVALGVFVWKVASDGYEPGSEPLDAFVLPVGVVLGAAVVGLAWPFALLWLVMNEVLLAVTRWRRR